MPNRQIPYHTILSAKNGDSEAMQQIISHYAAYIAFFSRRTFIDKYGVRHQYVDEDMRQRIEAKLMYEIIYHFDPYKMPPNT